MSPQLTIQRPPARRRRRLPLLAVPVIAALTLGLSACSPSTDTVERGGVVFAHWWLTGSSVSANALQCSEFNQAYDGNFHGNCWAEGWNYTVSSHYTGDLAVVDVQRQDGASKSSSWIKGSDGRWTQFSWQM